MNFYTQTMVELILALGAAMVLANLFAIMRRKRDEAVAKEALQKTTRASRQMATTLAKNQIKEGKATLAVAPLGRSIIFILIGLVAVAWSLATLLTK